MQNPDIYDGKYEQECKKIYEDMDKLRDRVFNVALDLRDEQWLEAFNRCKTDIILDGEVIAKDCVIVPKVSLTKDYVLLLSVEIHKP